METIDWYESQSLGLGKKFYNQLSNCLIQISEFPNLYPELYKNYRRALLNQFPYFVFYSIQESQKVIQIFGVLHTSRNPQIWKTRKGI
ncbi:MAG: type II toxin-antitoxin system RelE/ParE family toxin [Leptospiraceae bacterium]|nr:type II toxin-antitoxin system RelE/ParE family toxin [Leptospiraceae bacterium]